MPGLRGRGRGAQSGEGNEGRRAGELPGSGKHRATARAGLKDSGSCADGTPRPPGAPPTRPGPAPPLRAPAAAPPRVPARAPGQSLCPLSCGLRTRSAATRGRPHPRSTRTRSPPPPRLPTLISGTRWNFLGLPPLGARRACARAPRCGLAGWCAPLARVPREQGGVLTSA